MECVFATVRESFVPLQPIAEFLEVIVNSLIKLSHIIRLLAQTGIISIHRDITILESNWEITDINEEELGAKA